MARDGFHSLNVDVAIVGGGPAGAAVALHLARGGIGVAILERTAEPRLKVGETFAPGMRVELQQLNVWNEFVASGHLPSAGRESAWGREVPSSYAFIVNAYGCGWHVDRGRFDRMMLRSAEAEGAIVRTGVRVTNVKWDRNVWHLIVRSGANDVSEMNARIVVDATGRASSIARMIGARHIMVDHLVAFVAYSQLRQGEAQTTLTSLVEATENGWWYSAPIPENRLVLAFMTDGEPGQGASPGKSRWKQWMGWMESAPLTRTRARRYDAPNACAAVAAYSAFLLPRAGAGWVAVGDAAYACDPLAGDGVYHALSEAPGVAARVETALKRDPTILAVDPTWGIAAYRTYLRARRAYYRLETRWPASPFWQRRRHQDLPLPLT